MEEEFLALLLASSGVISLVPAGRINWGEHPQGSPLPGIVMNVVSGNEGLTMKGPNGLHEGRVQIDVYGDTYTSAKEVSRAIQTALHGYRGGGFRLITHISTRDSREGGTNEPARPYRVGMDFNTAWRAI